MSNYVIFADSGCDMYPETLKEWNVTCASLIYKFENENREYLNGDQPAKEFYNRMREGAVATTSAVNMETFKTCFRPTLKAGKDILYIGFSSGLSTTFNSARLAAEELLEEFPERQIRVVDSLAASAGYGMLLYLAKEKRDAGATLDELVAYVEDIRLKVCHWFTVDDLKYLKRGGRVSPTVALVGSLLGIKPILHVDNEGHLISMGKVRGRQAALAELVNKMGEKTDEKPEGPIFICNADCEQDVETVKALINEKYSLPVDMVVDTGAVIGAHSGPGTIALFFVGKER